MEIVRKLRTGERQDEGHLNREYGVVSCNLMDLSLVARCEWSKLASIMVVSSMLSLFARNTIFVLEPRHLSVFSSLSDWGGSSGYSEAFVVIGALTSSASALLRGLVSLAELLTQVRDM